MRLTAVMVAGCTLVAVLLARFLPYVEFPLPLCLFKKITGLPCPLCGGLTAFHCLSRGDLGGAFARNPLVAAAATAALLFPLATLVIPPARISGAWRAFARRGVLIPLVLVLWGYLIWRTLAS